MSIEFFSAYHTATGRREQNEDVVGIVTTEGSGIPTRSIIVALADGVSGSDGGRIAAEASVQEVLSNYSSIPTDLPISSVMGQWIKKINSLFYQQARHRSVVGSTATTLSVLVIRDRFYDFAHVGDCRLYLLRDGVLSQLTMDHVRDNAEMRHVLTRAVGLNADIEIDHGTGAIHSNDVFLLASDGVWGALSFSDIEWHLSTLTEDPPDPRYTAKLLVDAALANGSKDNATAAVVRVIQVPESRDSSPLIMWKIIGTLVVVLNLILLALLILR